MKALLRFLGFLALVAVVVWAMQGTKPEAIAEATETTAPSTGKTRPKLPTAEELKKLPKDGGPKYNRLVFEKSPYLLQHAANPVDWHPWGPEAFEIAKKRDLPVFLSVGYATCHWCHVMEHESFEDEALAKYLNENFINVKVDREEMPHVDQVYMTVTQGMNNGRGGWPMSVMMTWDRKPFFSGTYFPKTDFESIAQNVIRLWKGEERNKLTDMADGITEQLRALANSASGELPDAKVLDEAFAYFESTYDNQYGGFGGPPNYAPKFPKPHDYALLLRYWKRSGSKRALEIVERSLTEMRLGGMWDQVGFGTHRYATDREWLVPHFEKMLYDQALLAMANIDAYQATGKAIYKQTAEDIFTYVLRDMRAPEGGFYSAEDADSEGEEGKFYVWSNEDLKKVLGDEDGEFFIKLFHFEPEGNWVEEAHPNVKTHTNIPHLKGTVAENAERLKMKESELAAKIEMARQRLFAAREKRIHPLKDDKILTDWNGLMIAALARGGVAFRKPEYTQAAEDAAAFVLKTLREPNGRLIKRYRDGEAGLPAHLEDYAYLLWGLVELYEASFDPQYLKESKALAQILFKRYWDPTNGGFFMTADDGEELIVRSKEVYDGAQPSGNSVATLNLLRLARLTGDTTLEERAKDTIKAFSKDLTENPGAYTVMLQAIDFLTGDTREIVVAGKEGAADTQAMLDLLQLRFDPNKVVLFKPDGPAGAALSKVVNYVENHGSKDGKANVYVCRNFACQLPTTEIEKVKESLQ